MTTGRDSAAGLLARAISIAAEAHGEQVDKAGAPYILHPLRVMLAVQTDEQRLAAVLHDVLEDTSVDLDRLAAEGIPEAVRVALVALTKTKGELRVDAARRAARNPIARAVKLADVTDNMDLGRLGRAPGPADLERMKEYEQVREILLSFRP